jgi:hypothetical protein
MEESACALSEVRFEEVEHIFDPERAKSEPHGRKCETCTGPVRTESHPIRINLFKPTFS